MGMWLKETAQWIGRRSSGSRREESLGFAERRDSTFDAISRISRMHDGGRTRAERTVAFTTGFVDCVFGVIFLHDVHALDKKIMLSGPRDLFWGTHLEARCKLPHRRRGTNILPVGR
jgi:hypothetical protein